MLCCACPNLRLGLGVRIGIKVWVRVNIRVRACARASPRARVMIKGQATFLSFDSVLFRI